MRHAFTWAGLILLAACSGNSDDKTGTANETTGAEETPAAKAGPLGTSSVTLSPGEWEMTNEVVEMSIPGMPAGAIPKQAMQKTTIKSCLTPEQTAKPNADFFSGRKNSNCTYDGFEMTAGTVNGTISCPSADGTQKMTIAGKYEPESYDVQMDMASERMNMKVHTSGKRLGECPAS